MLRVTDPRSVVQRGPFICRLVAAPQLNESLFEQDVCTITFALAPNLTDVSNYVQKCLDLPCSFADACLLRMSESMPRGVVLTLDADFRVYRRNKRKRIPLLMPPGR